MHEARRADDLLHLIEMATAPVTGEEYFGALVRRLAELLGVRVALITECLEYPENHVRTLAYWKREGFRENIAFELTGTPCEEVIRGGEFRYLPAGVHELYPEWAAGEGGICSFVGIPIHASSDGRVIGHLAAYHDHELDDARVVESVFRVVAARAGAELERLQAETALRDSEERARQHLTELAHVSRLGAMGELASAIAHEVKQPLSAIMLYCQTASRRLDQGNAGLEDVRTALLAARRSAEQASGILDNLRRYLRRKEPRKAREDVGAVVRDTAELLRPECRAADVSLSLDLPSFPLTAEFDRILIQQVISNLVRNGMEATRDQRAGHRHVTVTASAQPESMVAIAVADNGPGVPPHIRERLFSPFVTSKAEGMGIGLSLCRSIVEDHGGRLRLVDEAAETTFRFTLPAA